MPLALVTGGHGFIGRHLVQRLQSLGGAVRVLDLAELPETSLDAEFVRGSVEDAATLERALSGVDHVYHLAGIAHLWHRDRGAFDRVNHRGTETVLQVAAEAGIGRVVHCSTEAVLLPRRRESQAIDESVDPILADMPGPYTRSKLLAEHAALRAAHGGLDVVIVNPTVPIGAGDRNKTPPAAMLDLFLSGGSRFFLDCTLNLVGVADVADGIARAGQYGRSAERYILGGENLALRDLLAVLEKKSGRRMPQRSIPPILAEASGFVAEWVSNYLTKAPPVATREGVTLALRSAPFDCAKARKELGYAPKRVDGALTEVVEAFKRGGENSK